jgi:hypothetical protein
MAQITINEGLAWLKTLKKRHEELLALRNDNAHRERRFYGASADKEIVKEPVYDVKVLDRLVTRVAREIRLLGRRSRRPTQKRPSMPTIKTTPCWANWCRRQLWGRPEERAVSWVCSQPTINAGRELQPSWQRTALLLVRRGS